MRIELLHVPDCPNLDRTHARLLDALDSVGVDASVQEVKVATAASAAATGMHGSPTILVDGVDAFPSSLSQPSLSCRLFRTPRRLEGAPTVAQLVEVLARVVADTERDQQPEFDRAAVDTDEGCCDADLLCVGNDEVARALAAAGFAAMWAGTAAHPSELVPDSPDAAAEVATALADRGRAELDADGRLVGIHGLTLRATRHHIVHDDRAHWTWCAFDAIGIAAALGIDATARTDCPVCRTPITVALRHGVPEDHSAVLWLPSSSGSNLMSDFCAHADLYCSREHLEQRIDFAARPGRVVDVCEGATLGRVSWADVADVDTT